MYKNPYEKNINTDSENNESYAQSVFEEPVAASESAEETKQEAYCPPQNPYYDPNYAQTQNAGYPPNNNPYYGMPQVQKQPFQGLAIASMVLGIVAFLCYGFPCGILAVIFAAVARSNGNRSGMSIAGLVCGIVAMVIWTLYIVFIFVLLGMAMEMDTAINGLSFMLRFLI